MTVTPAAVRRLRAIAAAIAPLVLAACGGAARSGPAAAPAPFGELAAGPGAPAPAEERTLRRAPADVPPTIQSPRAGPAAPPAAPGSGAQAAAAAPGSGAQAAATGTGASPSGPAPASGDISANVPVVTALSADLAALGLDAARLPPLQTLEPRVLRAVMKLFARSLGLPCGGCHEEGDFAAPTRRKKIAARMWDEFAVGLRVPDGGPVFCDSCHVGRVRFLDRSDPQALERWMEDHFVARLARNDGAPHGCETCHPVRGKPFLFEWGR